MKRRSLLFSVVVVSLLFAGCGSDINNQKSTKSDKKTFLSDSTSYNAFLEKGKNSVMSTGMTLVQNLTGAIEKGGTTYAIEFCKLQAQPLTDSMSTLSGSNIKRVTDRPRNPLNKANADELSYILQLKSMLAAGEKATPTLSESNGKITGYYPIITGELCMKCHGDKASIEKNILDKISKLYTSDSATGYKPNELRGLWVVEMSK